VGSVLGMRGDAGARDRRDSGAKGVRTSAPIWSTTGEGSIFCAALPDMLPPKLRLRGQ